MSNELKPDEDLELALECCHLELLPGGLMAPIDAKMLGIVLTEIERLRAEVSRHEATLDAVMAVHKEIVDELCRQYRETQEAAEIAAALTLHVEATCQATEDAP